MFKGKDFRVIILGSSLLFLIALHTVTTGGAPFTDNAGVMLKKGSRVELEGHGLDLNAPHNAPFNYSKLQINSISMESLETVPGIGPALANRIIEFRRSNGDFTSLDSLIKVSGVGPAKIKILKEYTRL